MKYKWIILIVVLLVVSVFGAAKAQDNDCILVYNDDDEEGFYDELFFTDKQGRDICKVRVVFHDPIEGDPNGATFTESGTVNGYSANFDGASVHVWRSGSPYSISHSKVWVHQPATPTQPPTSTPTQPSTATPTEPTPTNTPETPTPTGTIATPTPTSTITITLTVTPTMTGTLPTPFITETPPEGTPDMPPVSYPPPMLPETGGGGHSNNIGAYLGIVIVCILMIVAARAGRRAR